MTTAKEKQESQRGWSSSGGKFRQFDIKGTKPLLEPGIYFLEANMEGLYLRYDKEKFPLPEKIYGVHSKMINRIYKTYNTLENNLGCIFDGIKGTGKSVTAELICNELNLPVIVITSPYSGIDSFVGTIDQEVIIFVDEFEKIFSNDILQKKESSETTMLLSLTDGVSKSFYKRLFIFTSNSPGFSDKFIDRPGRIRYIKTFGNLEVSTIEEIVDDLLENKDFRSDAIKFISSLNLITIDIVKSIIQEINIHDEPPKEFEDVFNVRKLSVSISIFCAPALKPDDFTYYSTRFIHEFSGDFRFVDTESESLEIEDEIHIPSVGNRYVVEVISDTIIKASSKYPGDKNWKDDDFCKIFKFIKSDTVNKSFERYVF